MKKQSLKRAKVIDWLSLDGLRAAPAQHWRAVTIVPLIRTLVGGDLRLASVSGQAPMSRYTMTPMGMVLSWQDDGTGTMSWETLLTDHSSCVGSDVNLRSRVGSDVNHLDWVGSDVNLRNTDPTKDVRYGRTRRVERLSDVVRPDRSRVDRVRFMSMQLAIESYLELFHKRPMVSSRVFSQEVLRHGLREQSVHGVRGERVRFLSEALRVFEIHDNQCGMVLMLNGRLASVFVVPHPEDYRQLHDSVLLDIYGEVFRNLYGQPYEDQSTMKIAEQGIKSLEDLSRAYELARHQWASQQIDWSSELLGQPVHSQPVYQAGPFSVQRFISPLVAGDDGHVGEAIVRADGRMEYLKTFRLNRRQVRRARMVKALADHDWSLHGAAKALGMRSVAQLRQEAGYIGLGYLFRRQ